MNSTQLNQDELIHLRSQNDKLWKVIKKQRVVIQNFQKENARLSADRDRLADKAETLEKELTRKKRVTSLLISPEALQEISEKEDSTPTSPILPPRSPYRPIKEKPQENDLFEVSIQKNSPSPTRSKSSSSIEIPHSRESNLPAARNTPLSPTSNRGRPKHESAVYSRSMPHNSPVKNTSSPNLSCPKSPEEEDPVQENTLKNIHLKVVGSTIKFNDKKKEVIAFIISIGSHDDDERWRVEKLYSDFLTLDSKLKSQHFNRSISTKMGKLPDKALFSNNAPNKVDQRKIALEQYLQHILTFPLDDVSDLCEFLSTDIIEATEYKISGHKEGYLTKRGKNFGGWKTRYFVINDSVLEYYESKEGTQLGSIRLTNAQIGRQIPGSTPTTEEYNKIYRHAFMIVEQRKAGSSNQVRHILCANSDKDRDEWFQVLLENIQTENDRKKPSIFFSKKKPRKLSKGEIRAISAQPMSQLKLESSTDKEKFTNNQTIDAGRPPTPSLSSESSDSLPATYDAPRMSFDQLSTNKKNPTRPPLTRRSSMCALVSDLPKQDEPVVRQRAASPTVMSTEDPEQERKIRNKANRMTFWGKKMFSSNNDQQTKPIVGESDGKSVQSTNSSGIRGFLARSSQEPSEKPKIETKSTSKVFGVSLEEAVRNSRINEGYDLPAIVYRCIEYLDAMNAVQEEGLYRLSGSNASMKGLRERFDIEGDVNLLTSNDGHDVHVVAGLLKLWLRELPTSVLTRDLRDEFLHVIDLLDRKDRVNELGRLVSLLPIANYTLLRALTAHLIRVVRHSDINKMTMRNVSIVFSPTLGIPATIFNFFMSEFEYIFWTTENGAAAPRRIEEEKSNSLGINQKISLRLVREEHGRSNRNSVNYMDGAPNSIVDLEKSTNGPNIMDEDEEEDDLILNETNY